MNVFLESELIKISYNGQNAKSVTIKIYQNIIASESQPWKEHPQEKHYISSTINELLLDLLFLAQVCGEGRIH